MNIHRTLAATLAAMAIAAPAASAMPADMHASTAQAAAQQRQAPQQRQDLRSADARDAAQHPRKTQTIDAPGATVVDSQTKVTPVAPGQPTWPVNPQSLTPPAQHVSTTSSDDGVDWVTVGIGVGITLLVLGGIVALTNRSRSLPRTRVSA